MKSTKTTTRYGLRIATAAVAVGLLAGSLVACAPSPTPQSGSQPQSGFYVDQTLLDGAQKDHWGRILYVDASTEKPKITFMLAACEEAYLEEGNHVSSNENYPLTDGYATAGVYKLTWSEGMKTIVPKDVKTSGSDYDDKKFTLVTDEEKLAAITEQTCMTKPS